MLQWRITLLISQWTQQLQSLDHSGVEAVYCRYSTSVTTQMSVWPSVLCATYMYVYTQVSCAIQYKCVLLHCINTPYHIITMPTQRQTTVMCSFNTLPMFWVKKQQQLHKGKVSRSQSPPLKPQIFQTTQYSSTECLCSNLHTTNCSVYLPVSGTHTLTPPTMDEVVWPARPSHVITAQLNILASQTMHAWGVEGIACKGMCICTATQQYHMYKWSIPQVCGLVDCNTNLVW